ncbi:MAG: type 4a pilus biogenesis protein PilO [Candidatus Omnitrophica bacterium]|nr:type 4a pilus biogenesis protein PilO [Candidatus Omnitrophota bacterium]
MDTLKQDFNIGEALAKHKDYVIIGVAVVVSLIISKVIYGNQMKEYDRLKGEIAVEQEKGQALDRIVKVSNQVKEMKKTGWDTTEFDAIGRRIGELARKRGVKIQNVDPADRVVEPNFIRIPFKVNAEGKTEDLTRFIRDVETLPMLTRVQRITMEPAGSVPGEKAASGQGAVLLVDMTIIAYYFK